MKHGLRTIVALLAAGLVVLAAGCGGSKSSSPPTTAPTTTQQGTTTTGSSIGNFASSKNCLEFASLASQIASAMAPNGGGGSSIENGANTLQAIANAAPSDIKGDLQTVASAFASYVHALQSSGYDPSSTTPANATQIAALVQAAKSFNTAKFNQAAQHLSAWEAQNCK